jgi:hypothetical protein
MRRNYWVVVASMVVMTVLAGCSDSVVAPAVAPSASPTSMLQAPEGRPTLSLSNDRKDSEETDFSISPWGGVYRVGNHAVVFPARSVCEPSTSNYAAAQWDAPCAPATSAIQVHAIVKKDGARTWVDFSPELRFVPSDNPAQWVWLFIKTPGARHAHGDLSRFNILYAGSIGGATVNDAATDATMRTYVDTRSGTTFRRVKHFSGYLGTSGFACDPTAEDCSGVAAALTAPAP